MTTNTDTTARPYAGGLSHGQVIAWRNAIFVIFAMPGIGLASWVARLPAVRDELGASPTQVGFLLFGMAAGSILGLTFSSHIIANFGARTSLIWSMLGNAIGLTVAGIGVSVGGNATITFIGLFIFGLFNGLTDVAMNVSGAANERVIRRSVMPLFHAFFSFGTMVGAGLGALAELAGLPIGIHLALASVVMLGSTLAVIRNLQSEHLVEEGTAPVAHGHESTTWRGRLAIWRDSRTLLIGLLVLGAAFAEGSANDWLAIAMVDGHGLHNAQGALVLGLFVTAMTAGRLAGAHLINRFGRVAVLRGSFLFAAAGLLIVIFVPEPSVVAFGAVLWGLGSSLGFPIGMSAAADDPTTAAARVAAVSTIGYLAFLAGPPVIGFLAEQFGVLNALLVVLTLVAVGALVAGAARESGAASAVPERERETASAVAERERETASAVPVLSPADGEPEAALPSTVRAEVAPSDT